MVEIFGIPFGGKSIIYAPLKRTAFIGNNALASIIGDMARENAPARLSSSPGEATAFVEGTGILLPDPPVCSVPSAGYMPANTTLFLTSRCNLRCKYCYASAGEHQPLDMPVEVARQAIDIACDNAAASGRKSFEVGFHGGGEPTMNWETLTAAIDHARKKPIKAVVSMASNGCYPEEKLACILDNFDSLSLSFDGLPDVQNEQRPRADGGPSSQAVIKTIRAMDKRAFRYGVRITVTPLSVERLPQMVEFLADNTGAKTVQVEPAFARGRGKSLAIAGKSASQFIRAFIDAYNLAEDRGIRLFYSGADLNRLTGTFCTAPCSTLVVLPGGEISTCFEVHNANHPLAKDFIFGKIENGKLQFDEDKWIRVAGRSIENLSHCKDCFCKYHCAGDCISKTFSSGSASRFRPSSRCRINRELAKHLLLKRIAKGGGLWKGNVTGVVKR